MIVLEGPDGSGKTSLLQNLVAHFKLPQHERACTSSGPIDEVARWAHKDVTTLHTQPLSIYDRHPLISEYTYANAIPERAVRPDFVSGWAPKLLQQFSQSVLLIMCIPPFSEVVKNVRACLDCGHEHHRVSGKPITCRAVINLEHEPSICMCVEEVTPHHMVGVAENILPIYQMYETLSVFWPNQQSLIIYDYTKPESIKRVFSRVQIHVTQWRKNHGQL